jgi:hypothetical protein
MSLSINTTARLAKRQSNIGKVTDGNSQKSVREIKRPGVRSTTSALRRDKIELTDNVESYAGEEDIYTTVLPYFNAKTQGQTNNTSTWYTRYSSLFYTQPCPA